MDITEQQLVSPLSGDEKLTLALGRLTASTGKHRREYHARFVKAGRIRAAGNRPGNIILEPGALERACMSSMFDGKAVFVDHAAFFEYPSLNKLAGVTSSASFDLAEQAVYGVIKLYSEAEPIARLLDELLAEGDSAPDIGLSIVFWPIWANDPPSTSGEGSGEGSKDRKIVDIRHVESVDLVFEPAADGRIIQALSAHSGGDVAHASACAVEHASACVFPFHGGVPMSLGTAPVTNPTVSPRSLGDVSPRSLGDVSPRLPGDPPVTPSTTVTEEWDLAVRRAAASSIIAASGLPAASRERLAALPYESPEAVEHAIQDERNFIARLAQDNVVQIGGTAPRDPAIQMGMTGLDRVRLAAEALLMGTRPQANVAPLSGLRELYILLSGDYEMTGMFQSDRVYLANVNSSTMAGMVANALNKAVINLFQEYPRWWEPISQIVDFSSLQQVKWITLGGVGELPTVAEGAAYTEMTWDDQTETATFVKKGGYLGITLEAIDKDDTRKLQAAPRALAQAAWLTLSKAVSEIFTSNSGVGPTMSDAVALFHANHSNIGTTALSLTSYTAVRTAMRKQTEVNSGERLGAICAPKFLLVPPDLEVTALQVLASPADYTYALSNAPGPGPDNVFAEGDQAMTRLSSARNRVIVVDLWTDTNNWAAAADPLLYPTIGLGFRYGRTPEIFSVASPTAGLMFTNDTLPIKARYFFAVGPMDWRGLYKQNVA